MVVSVFEESCIDLHLACEYGSQPVFHLIPRWNVVRPLRQLALGRNDTEFLLPREGLLAQLVPTLIELTFVFRDPILGNVVRRVGGAGREVNKEWLVGRHRLLLMDPGDGSVRQILHEVITIFRRPLRFDRGGAFEQRWVVLITLAADK